MTPRPEPRTPLASQLLSLLRGLCRPGNPIALPGDRAQRAVAPAPGVALGRNAPPAVLTHGALVSEARTLGLIVERDGQIGVTAAGKAWVRRHLAGGDAFQDQHRELCHRPLPTTKGKPAARAVINLAESPLAWLRQRKDRDGRPMLDEKQFEAGERLRRDFTFAALEPRVTADWSSNARSGRQSPAAPAAHAMRDDVIAAKERVRRAITAVGPELGSIMIDVCCLLKGIEVAETAHELPRRSGKVVLQLALTALARHYGLLGAPERTRASMHILHWAQSDYRPRIDGATGTVPSSATTKS